MARQQNPDIERWRDSVSPDSYREPTSARPAKGGEKSKEDALSAVIPPEIRQKSYFSHPRIYPIHVKILTLCWIHVIVQLIGMIYVLPITSLEKHMMMLEDSNVVVSNLWWFYASSGATQMEYYRRERRRELDGWISGESEVAWDRLLRNIGPIFGAEDGVIVASPSDGSVPGEPDYYYTWTRDAALTMSTIITQFLPDSKNDPWQLGSDNVVSFYNGSKAEDPVFEPLTRSYIAAQANIQQGQNPSGDLWTGGLNEPKFGVDGSRFDGEWGRPQRDGHHLFTLLSCLRALQEGANLASRLDDPKAAEYYLAQTKRLSDILPAFWNDNGYWQSTAHIEGHSDAPPANVDREWLDCALPLSVIHLGSNDLFAATRSEILASLRAYTTSFRDLYPVNAPPPPPSASARLRAWFSNRGPTAGEADWTKGWAVGRYAEDIYNGVGMGQGNPWYICTFSVAHVLYLAKEGFAEQGYIPLNNLTRPFWSDLLGSLYEDDAEGYWSREKDEKRKPLTTKLFRTALTQLGEVGDRYISVGRKHAPSGRMSEQMNRHDGSPVGARDLTWSYVSFIEAARARDRAG